MTTVDLHIVGGFLGSGKTTAIIQAARLLMRRGKKVGVITNDQGRYLVDTAFFQLANVPAVEVTGGCFCCNYDDLDARLSELIAAEKPDVIFAESVGSCADVVATVVKPLLAIGCAGAAPTSYSVFADARMLRRRLMGLEMPFSDDVVYIFDKQIEEAGLVVINKIDLLSAYALEEMRVFFKDRLPGKQCILQTSLDEKGVMPWLELLQRGRFGLPEKRLDIDYRRYSEAEARLAWVDSVVMLHVRSGEGQSALRTLIRNVLDVLKKRGAGIGHLKLLVRDGTNGTKLSFPTLEEPGWAERIPALQGSEISILINARVEMPAEELRMLLRRAVTATGLRAAIQEESAFHPSQPNPTHRL